MNNNIIDVEAFKLGLIKPDSKTLPYKTAHTIQCDGVEALRMIRGTTTQKADALHYLSDATHVEQSAICYAHYDVCMRICRAGCNVHHYIRQYWSALAARCICKNSSVYEQDFPSRWKRLLNAFTDKRTKSKPFASYDAALAYIAISCGLSGYEAIDELERHIEFLITRNKHIITLTTNQNGAFYENFHRHNFPSFSSQTRFACLQQRRLLCSVKLYADGL